MSRAERAGRAKKMNNSLCPECPHWQARAAPGPPRRGGTIMRSSTGIVATLEGGELGKSGLLRVSSSAYILPGPAASRDAARLARAWGNGCDRPLPNLKLVRRRMPSTASPLTGAGINFKCEPFILHSTQHFHLGSGTPRRVAWQYKNLLNSTYLYILECTDSFRVCFSAGFAAAVLHC